MALKKSAIILAAGIGRKMFPFSTVRSKTTIKIAGIPLIRYNAEKLAKIGCEDIVVVTSVLYQREIQACLSPLKNINVVCVDENCGSADSLVFGANLCTNDNILVIYGDTIIDESDLERLYSEVEPAALLYPLSETSKNWIGATITDNRISEIGAHYRGSLITHQFAAFNLDVNIISQIAKTPDYFPNVKCGVGVPRERFVEAGLIKPVQEGQIKAVEGQGIFFDIDKPWHMLAANEQMVKIRTGKLTGNTLAEGARISERAIVRGFVQLGKNSMVGDNVLIEGNVIVGENTVIDNGAIISGSAVIGDNTKIRNYCHIYDGVSIGSDCILDHGSEFIGGLMMDKVYLYHYCEMYGALGNFVDIGAATVCGTLRFDDSDPRQRVKGRSEIPLSYGDAIYIGDYCRTGVNTILMPGCKIGSYSAVGPGVILVGDVEENSLIQVKQELTLKKWGYEKYGW
ncbi:NTP transferase domain-containing protein [Clostridium sp. BNL1100]|uniref:NTP transferase domain-containing protein n=1 Tax=Clostridium sp. BNL1100 TaxID=755731 RepID=UPI00024A79A6|nr:NTP transferase domain-containing protein [Clostridium sp. BNL1100]AEY67434.1 Nucleoside-diphosphate-sugar pyrophosphorylase family protein [Clostridium sp. BNL1100]